MLGTITLPGAWVLLALWVYFTLCDSVISSTFCTNQKEKEPKTYSNLSLVVCSVLQIRNIIWLGSTVILTWKSLLPDYKVSLEIYAYLFNKLDMHLQWSPLSQSRGPNVSIGTIWRCTHCHHPSDPRCPDTATSSKVRSRFLASGKRLFVYYLSSSLDKIWSSTR